MSTSIREGLRQALLALGLLLVVPVIGIPLIVLLDATVGEIATTVILGIIVGPLIAALIYRDMRKDTPEEERRLALLKTAGWMVYLIVQLAVIVTVIAFLYPEAN